MKSRSNNALRRLGMIFVGASLALGCGKWTQTTQNAEAIQASAVPGDDEEGQPIETFSTQIRRPPPIRGVATSMQGHHGSQVTLQCSSCHSVRPSNPDNSKSSEMDEFHQQLRISHGDLRCVGCHNPNDQYASLRLADGRPVAFEDSMTLCAQCHGPQYRDYLKGAHGGMTGYWDLSRGGRERNHCQHCHDPHVPNYPKFIPVAAPRDRFQPKHSTEEHDDH
jgi:hypothetical protein